MSHLIKMVFSVCALCVLYTGCFTVKPEAEVTLTHGRIILDTTQPYTPQVGDKYILDIRFEVMGVQQHSWSLLDSVAGFLIHHPNVVCEIGCHTSRWSLEYSDPITLRRAKSLMQYIIEKGIDPQRIVPVGYDDNVPRILEDTKFLPEWNVTLPKGAHLTEEYIHQLNTKNEQEAAHYLNRRTELVIVGVMHGK